MKKKTKVLLGILIGVGIGIITGGVFYFLKKRKYCDMYLDDFFQEEEDEEYGTVTREDCKGK